MNPLKRIAKMSDARLVDRAQQAVGGANRDVDELTPFGWDQDRIDALEQKRQNFADTPDDVELSGMMMEATAAKRAARKAGTEYCAKEIMLRVTLKYGDRSTTMKRFRAGELYTATDHGCWLVMKRIHRQATLLLTDLATEGLTAAHLTTLADLITDMNNKMEAQDAAIDNRDLAVQQRILLGNELYAELVKLAEVGKRIWLNVDESKYNDYVLYPKTGGVEPDEDQQVFENEVAAEGVLNLSVTGIDGSETMTAKNTGAVPLVVYFAAQPTDLPAPGSGQLDPGEEATGTAAQAGYQSGVKEYLNVYNPSTDTVGSFELTVIG